MPVDYAREVGSQTYAVLSDGEYRAARLEVDPNGCLPWRNTVTYEETPRDIFPGLSC